MMPPDLLPEWVRGPYGLMLSYAMAALAGLVAVLDPVCTVLAKGPMMLRKLAEACGEFVGCEVCIGPLVMLFQALRASLWARFQRIFFTRTKKAMKKELSVEHSAPTPSSPSSRTSSSPAENCDTLDTRDDLASNREEGKQGGEGKKSQGSPLDSSYTDPKLQAYNDRLIGIDEEFLSGRNLFAQAGSPDMTVASDWVFEKPSASSIKAPRRTSSTFHRISRKPPAFDKTCAGEVPIGAPPRELGESARGSPSPSAASAGVSHGLEKAEPPAAQPAALDGPDEACSPYPRAQFLGPSPLHPSLRNLQDSRAVSRSNFKQRRDAGSQGEMLESRQPLQNIRLPERFTTDALLGDRVSSVSMV